jgi:hypothetical protein
MSGSAHTAAGAGGCPYAAGRLREDPLSSIPDGEVGDRDPLRLDSSMALLPAWNADEDIRSIAAAVRAGVARSAEIAEWGPRDAAAALRDLGMLLASLKRHGVEPVTAVPEVEPLVLRLGAVTGMPPRDTVFHYVPWNPVGRRARRFTTDPGEDGLVAAVRRSVHHIGSAVQRLSTVYAAPVGSVDFAAGCTAAGVALTHLAEAMVGLRSDVDPVFFARRLRPYFQQISLGGCAFSGAAAAPLAVGIVDHLVWSSDCDNAEYRDFQADTVRYGLPDARRLYEGTLGVASLTSRLVRTGPSPELQRSARALDSVFKVLVTFRGRHLVIARAAYRADRRMFAMGSGGYATDTLGLLLRLTRAARRRLGDAIPVG